MAIDCGLLQVGKMDKLLKVRTITSLQMYISPCNKNLETFKFGQQVNLIQKFLLCTPSQEVVTSLPHNYVNFFISSYIWATVMKFGQLKQLLDRNQ